MTTINTDKETLGHIGTPKKETTLANKNNGKKSHERTASTEAEKALKSSDDEDPFNNMPV
jgi:hypothetical protein